MKSKLTKYSRHKNAIPYERKVYKTRRYKPENFQSMDNEVLLYQETKDPILLDKIINGYKFLTLDTQWIASDSFEDSDIVSFAYEGLIVAIRTYNGTYSFYSWARLKIHYEIITCIRREGLIPRSYVEYHAKLDNFISEFRYKYNKEPTKIEIDKEISPIKVPYRKVMSLDSLLLYEFNLDNKIRKIENGLVKEFDYRIFNKNIFNSIYEVLNERETKVFDYIVFDNLILQDIANLMNFTPPRITQIRDEIKRKIIVYNINLDVFRQ